MKRKLTFKKIAGICLLLLAFLQTTQAQFPKLLADYPIIIGNGGVKTMAKKDNIVYTGGDFTAIGKAPIKGSLIFDNATATQPNLAFSPPDGIVSKAVADGAGGWYIVGAFSKIGGIARNRIARINANGTLNNWITSIKGFVPSDAILNGNTLIVSGGALETSDTYLQPVAAIDVTTGAPVPGWKDLGIAKIQSNNHRPLKIQVSNNHLYILSAESNGNGAIDAVDISDIQHPKILSSFKTGFTTQINNGIYLEPYIRDMAVSGDAIYLTADFYSSSDGQTSTYDLRTTEGQVFNAALFTIDATTGKFLKAFEVPGAEPSRFISPAIAVDGTNVYFYSSRSETSSRVTAYNAETGADISTSWPAVPFNGKAKLEIRSDHMLTVYGGYLLNNDDNYRSVAVLDPSTGVLQDWNPSILGSLVTFEESNGKYYAGGEITYNYPSTTASGLSAINMTTKQALDWTNNTLSGTFNSVVVYNNTLYVGGNFTSADGAIKNLAAFDITDAANPVLKTDWVPNPDNAINALTIMGNTLFVGGDFAQLNGQPWGRLAAFDVSSGPGILNPNWNPAPDAAITAFATLNNILYVGGSFTQIGATARAKLAAFDFGETASGGLTGWIPDLSFYGSTIGLTTQAADGSNHGERVFVGTDGFMSDMAGVNYYGGIGAVNTTDGAIDPWQFPITIDDVINSAYNTVTSNMVIGPDNKMYVSIGQGLFPFDISTNFASIPNAPVGEIDRFINSVLLTDNLLFVGGSTLSGVNPSLIGLAVFQTGQLQAQLTFADFTKTYGDADVAPAATSNNTGLPITYALSEQKDANGNAATVAEITEEGKLHILMPGTAKITASQAGNAEYLAPADLVATLTINKAELTIHPQDASAVVNQPLPDFPFTITGWKLDDETKPGIYNGKPEFATTATQTSPAGTYEITVNSIGTLLSDYYTFTPSSTDKATLTINTTGSTQQTITFAALPAKTYGEADFDAGAITDGSGLAVQYSSSDENIATVTNGKIHLAGAGTVTITASQHGDPTYAPATDVMQTLTIAKAPLTITADDKIKDRGAANPAFTATYAGLVNGDKATNLTTVPTFSTTATATSKPGTYPITVADASSNNYNITYVNGTLTIRGTQIITWAPLSTLTYGDAPFNPGAVSDADTRLKPVYTTSNPSIISISGAQAIIKGAGTATITATFAAANGFDLTTATLPVTILKKQLVVTAQDKSRNYGEPNPVLTYTFNGFVNADNATSGALTVQPTATTTATAISPTGVYPVTITGATSNNYDIVYVGANLTVNAVERTLTFGTIANKTYGNADFDAAAASSTGETLVYTSSNADVATVLDGKIHITGAGTAQITATLPPNPGYTGATTVTQTLTVAKAPLIITADNKNKSQGPPDILLTATYSGFAGTDNQLNLTTRPVLTTTAKTNSPTGTYPIIASGASSPNYEISYQPGTLTIVLGIGQEDVIVNQALSPNGDGLNDYFQINGINNFPDNHVAIINRNGQKVYEVNGYDNATKAFTGKSSQDGNVLQQGTYFYRIEYKLNGQQVRKSGYLVLKY